MKYFHNPVFLIGLLISTSFMDVLGQGLPTPPNLSDGLAWQNWWQVTSVSQVEAQFNAGRRFEELQKNLPANSLGFLNLPSNYFNLNFQEQALILLNAERTCRHNVNYPGYGSSLGLPLEGVEVTLSQVSQGHATDMQVNDFFGHTSSNGQSAATRINNAFPNCWEFLGENIAWNSIMGGSLIGIPLAFYGFIYDDACCNWGHRQLCLRQSTTHNNYNGTSKYGLVGFGRAVGSNGDYFVMDFIDPKPNCTYNVTNFQGGGNCPATINLSGTIASGEYQASETIIATGTIASNADVEFVAGSDIQLGANFQISAGADFNMEISNCSSASEKTQNSSSILSMMHATHVGNKPLFKME